MLPKTTAIRPKLPLALRHAVDPLLPSPAVARKCRPNDGFKEGQGVRATSRKVSKSKLVVVHHVVFRIEL